MMNAVVKHSAPIANVDQPASLLAVLSRAAADPATDVEKMERLGAMYERMQARSAETEYNAALSDMQDALPAIAERGSAVVSGQVRYTFALWEDINAAIKPVLKAHGFALSFRTDFSDGVSVMGVLSHKGGHSERTTIKLPADASGNKNAVQAVASSISYGKRYTASALLNLTSHGEDDDAYIAVDPIDPSWHTAIQDAADETELKKVKVDMVKHWHAVEKVPRVLVEAYKAKLQLLREPDHG